MQSLLLIQIGPVQEFIASARKSRDLWFGSWLLSELAKAAAHEIAIQNGLDSLIFPWTERIDDLKAASELNVGNKVVAVIEQTPTSFCQAVRENVQSRLKEIYQKAYENIPSDHFCRAIAEQQVDDLPEFYWVAVPFTDDQDYKNTRKAAEKLLAACKATRNFQPVSWGSAAPKSSLDGQRESVIDEKAYPPRNATPEQRKAIARILYRKYGVNEGERLCGIGLLKRHGESENTQESFFSTSHVAALPLLARLKPSDAAAVEAYANVLRDECELNPNDIRRVSRSVYPIFPYDGQFLFIERLPDLIGEGEEQKSTLAGAQKALKQLLEAAVGSRKPSPYYALLLADGDGMGKVIEKQNAREAHQELSKQLAGFARQVKEIVETTHKGSLVYAGGDDVLAFVPLHTVVACARALAERFQQQMKNFTICVEGQEVSPTLSVGIAVAHHLEPLSDVLNLARDAEKIAKRVNGKNALAITVSKRSGADRTIAGKWGELDRWLDGFTVLHRKDALPDGAAYELHELGRLLASVPMAIPDEASRILQRKRPQQGKADQIEDKVLKKLKKLLHELATKSEVGAKWIEQLANQMIIAKMLADASEQANIPIEDLPGIEFFKEENE